MQEEQAWEGECECERESQGREDRKRDGKAAALSSPEDLGRASRHEKAQPGLSSASRSKSQEKANAASELENASAAEPKRHGLSYVHVQRVIAKDS